MGTEQTRFADDNKGFQGHKETVKIKLGTYRTLQTDVTFYLI